MDLFIVILFLMLYYLRPQEWSGMFATIHFVQIVMLTGIVTLFTREGGFRPKDLFRTPHDWAVFGFWFWLVISAVHPWDTFKDNANLFIFYIVIVQALNSVPRMTKFVAWWTMLIVVVAFLALATMWGFDPLESLPITNGPMKNRLVLNLSIFNNPNALGHSVVPAIPMLYYYLIWKRPVFSRVAGVCLMLIPLYCIYLTVSKGAFLCAAVTVVATMAFGRPKKVQILIAVVTLIFGTTALYTLPRMNELNKSKSDEAIQGRVAAFEYGYRKLQTSFTGIGKAEWGKEAFYTSYLRVAVPPKSGSSDQSTHYVEKPVRYAKAAHSTYVCIGAELGKPGLYLFVAVLYCCFRTTMTANTSTSDEERIRRMLFVLVVSYVVSSWMVDFEYRPTFFMFTAAIAALHRHLLGLLPPRGVAGETVEMQSDEPVWRTPQMLPQPALATPLADFTVSQHILVSDAQTASASEEVTLPAAPIAKNWNRLNLYDAGAILLLTYLVIRFWAYIMARM